MSLVVSSGNNRGLTETKASPGHVCECVCVCVCTREQMSVRDVEKSYSSKGGRRHNGSHTLQVCDSSNEKQIAKEKARELIRKQNNELQRDRSRKYAYLPSTKLFLKGLLLLPVIVCLVAHVNQIESIFTKNIRWIGVRQDILHDGALEEYFGEVHIEKNTRNAQGQVYVERRLENMVTWLRSWSEDWSGVCVWPSGRR